MMFLLSTQQWTLILLAICVVPIAVLILLAIIFRIKNSTKKTVESDEVDNEQKMVFLAAFGGEENFISASLERIKVIVKVKDPDLIQGEKLQELGAKGVLIVGNEVRCSFGDRAEYVYKTLASDKLIETKEVAKEDNDNE